MPVTHFLTHFPYFKAEKRGFAKKKCSFSNCKRFSREARPRVLHTFGFLRPFWATFLCFRPAGQSAWRVFLYASPSPCSWGWGCQALKQGAQLPGGGGILPLESVAVNAEGVHALGVAHQALHLPGGQFFDLRANPRRPGCSRPTQARAPGWGRFTR